MDKGVKRMWVSVLCLVCTVSICKWWIVYELHIISMLIRVLPKLKWIKLTKLTISISKILLAQRRGAKNPISQWYAEMIVSKECWIKTKWIFIIHFRVVQMNGTKSQCRYPRYEFNAGYHWHFVIYFGMSNPLVHINSHSVQAAAPNRDDMPSQVTQMSSNTKIALLFSICVLR